jgi:hypothetical protein
MRLFNKRFQKALVYDWPLYLVLPVIFGVCVSYTLKQVHQPAANQKLNLFVASTSLESTAFCEEIQGKFATDGLKEVTTAHGNPSDSLFSQKLSVVGFSGSDLFLLPLSVMDSITPSEVMVPFTTSFEKDYIVKATPTYYVRDNVSYGVLVKSKGAESWLTSYIGFVDEDYYLCLNATSKNIGVYGGYQVAEDTLGLKTFAYLQGDAA